MNDQGLVILGDQLFPAEHFRVFHGFKAFMCEDYELCTHYKYHKQKIIFFLSAMREFAHGHQKTFKLAYHELETKPSFFKHLKSFSKGLEGLHIFEIEDKFFEERMREFCAKEKLQLHVHDSPKFIVRRGEFEEYLSKTKKPFMKNFYEAQRRQRGILMRDDDKPTGGKFSFDAENRKPFKGKGTPKIPEFKTSAIQKDVMALVEKHFKKHPGALEPVVFPLTAREANHFLKDFIEERLGQFGPFEDAITPEHPFLFHSLLSPLMNAGLLTPADVIDAVMKAENKKGVTLNSLEGFVRQVLGWREFMHGIYRHYSEKQEKANFFKQSRALTDDWYKGTTGLPPVDDTIKKVERYGYSHHIERLMILSNVMLLSGIHPQEVHRWFMEMYCDSADWVMGPNVYGMGQFSDGGIFATKPYICGANYWLKMSTYKKGEWCDTIDGLYWGFIEKHRKYFEGNIRLSMMVRTLDRMKPERQKILKAAAAKFIREKTAPLN